MKSRTWQRAGLPLPRAARRLDRRGSCPPCGGFRWAFSPHPSPFCAFLPGRRSSLPVRPHARPAAPHGRGVQGGRPCHRHAAPVTQTSTRSLAPSGKWALVVWGDRREDGPQHGCGVQSARRHPGIAASVQGGAEERTGASPPIRVHTRRVRFPCPDASLLLKAARHGEKNSPVLLLKGGKWVKKTQ